jgi:hypothetical protein
MLPILDVRETVYIDKLTVIEEYDPKTNRWRKVKDMPDAKVSFSTVVVGNAI